MNKLLTQQQAWDEYCEITRKYEEELVWWASVKDRIDDWKAKITEDYNKEITPLIPHIREKLFPMLKGGAGI